MSAGDRRRCPVCWQTVTPTMHRVMSGETYDLAELWRPRVTQLMLDKRKLRHLQAVS